MRLAQMTGDHPRVWWVAAHLAFHHDKLLGGGVFNAIDARYSVDLL
jgi:hypothetical protein